MKTQKIPAALLIALLLSIFSFSPKPATEFSMKLAPSWLGD